MARIQAFGWVVCLSLGIAASGQQAVPKSPNRLVAGKLVYVAPMPGRIDQWILEDLRRWGRHKLTGNPEGVDLVIEAHVPERSIEYQLGGGIPQPKPRKTEQTAQSDRCPRQKPSDPPSAWIGVTDWVTNERLWYVHLLDHKPKKDELDIPAGPHTDIFTRGLTNDQIALKLVTKLKEYVNELEKAEGKQ